MATLFLKCCIHVIGEVMAMWLLQMTYVQISSAQYIKVYLIPCRSMCMSNLTAILLDYNRYSEMALGFFILGPRTRMSGQIGVPSILCGSQNLGDPAPPPQRNC